VELILSITSHGQNKKENNYYVKYTYVHVTKGAALAPVGCFGSHLSFFGVVVCGSDKQGNDILSNIIPATPKKRPLLLEIIIYYI